MTTMGDILQLIRIILFRSFTYFKHHLLTFWFLKWINEFVVCLNNSEVILTIERVIVIEHIFLLFFESLLNENILPVLFNPT